MAALAFIFWWCVGSLMLLCLAVGLAPVMASRANEKEKRRKLLLLRAYPQLAKEIWQSIEEQDARHNANMKNLGETVGKAFEKAGNDIQRAVTPAPKKSNSKAAGAAVRTALLIARRIAK